MPRKGPRPHCWKVQGELNHQQYMAFLQMRAQANFRREQFLLSFDDFQQLWRRHWDLKGRSNSSYCLTRNDPGGAWELSNVECIPRVEHLRRQKLYKSKKTKWQNEATIRN